MFIELHDGNRPVIINTSSISLIEKNNDGSCYIQTNVPFAIRKQGAYDQFIQTNALTPTESYDEVKALLLF